VTRIPHNSIDREIDALLAFCKVQRDLLAAAAARRCAEQVGEAFEPEQIKCAA
jgi:hypothetical protein